MSNIDTRAFIEQLNEKWLSLKYVFPGPQPVSIERKHLPTLRSNMYYIGHKNDGERVALCILLFEEKPRCVFLNRKLEVKPISLRIPRILYIGTIFDCEIVDNEVYIFDCPLYAGESLKNRPFSERISFAQAFISGCKMSNDYTFHMKQFAKLTDYKTLNVCEKTDGYVLVPEKKPVQTGTHNFYYKWKPLLKNTIDFAIQPNKIVYLQNAGKLCKSNVTLTNIDDYGSYYKDNVIIVECMYVSNDTWKIIQLRDDKNIPNSLFTFRHTLINIEENIQFSELVSS